MRDPVTSVDRLGRHHRCRRGDGWWFSMEGGTAALRDKGRPLTRGSGVGFRVVCGPVQRETKERYNDNEG
jgi:hypothetical protein